MTVSKIVEDFWQSTNSSPHLLLLHRNDCNRFERTCLRASERINSVNQVNRLAGSEALFLHLCSRYLPWLFSCVFVVALLLVGSSAALLPFLRTLRATSMAWNCNIFVTNGRYDLISLWDGDGLLKMILVATFRKCHLLYANIRLYSAYSLCTFKEVFYAKMGVNYKLIWKSNGFGIQKEFIGWYLLLWIETANSAPPHFSLLFKSDHLKPKNGKKALLKWIDHESA